MNVLTTTHEPVEIRRSRLVALVACVAVLAAVVTWAVSTYAVGSSSQPTKSGVSATTTAHSSLTPKERQNVQAIFSVAGLAGARQSVSTDATSQSAATAGSREAVIMSITPAGLAAGALGGYALPSTQPGPTTAQILASMSPATRAWTKKVMSLTFAQLKGGGAGWP